MDNSFFGAHSSQVVGVLFSIAGVTLVALFSSHDHCSSSTPSHNVTHSHHINNSHTLTHNSGNNCVEESTPLGYVVSTGHMTIT